MNGLLIVTDMQGCISSINRAVEVELGHNRNELMGSKIDDLWHGQDLSELEEEMDQASESNDSLLVNYIYEKAKLNKEARNQSRVEEKSLCLLCAIRCTVIQ